MIHCKDNDGSDIYRTFGRDEHAADRADSVAYVAAAIEAARAGGGVVSDKRQKQPGP